jgi:hypothetical protein
MPHSGQQSSASDALAGSRRIIEQGRVAVKRLKKNLANDDPDRQDRMVDEFRRLILGR